MIIKSLRFALQEGRLRVDSQELDTGSAKLIREILFRPSPTVSVVTNDQLNHMVKFEDLVIDRGKKHPAVELSRLLLKPVLYHEKVLVLRTDYTVSSRLRTSIQKLLGKMNDSHLSNSYIIGVGKKIFEELQLNSSMHDTSRPISHKVPDDDFWSLISPPPEPIATSLAEKYVGISTHAQRVRTLVFLASRVNATVLILGETGTGKEVVARAIHDYDHRPDKGSFVPVNCSAIPDNLFESELFGYVRGAFSDAKTNRLGLWQTARRGTLFLDEIGDLSIDNQVKVLRALEEKRVRRVGSDQETDIEGVRVIAATNRDIHAMLVSEKFREDLYYRLIQFLIRTPSLRDHPEDIPILASHFWKEVGNSSPGTLAPETLEALKSYSWPGNARQLKLVLMNLHSFFPSEPEIKVNHLKFVLNYLGALHFNGDTESDQESRLNSIKVIRNLRRLEELMQMISIRLQPIIESDSSSPQSAKSSQSWLGFRMGEFEELCANPSLFGQGSLFLSAHGLLGRIKFFNELLKSDLKQAVEFWQKEVSKDFRGVQSGIHRQIEELFREA